jgi:3-hydroxyacyl-CoA dehydrogenase
LRIGELDEDMDRNQRKWPHVFCLQAGMKRIESNLQSRVKKGAMSADAAKKALSLVSPELTYDNFKVRLA